MSKIDIIRNKYQKYQRNEKVEEKWKDFFSDLDDEAKNYLKSNLKVIEKNTFDNEYTANSLRARLLIRAYRIAGHLKADLDPLSLTEKKYIPDLDPKTYGIEDSDLDKEVFIDGVFGINTISIRELIKILEKNYCGKIGLQFMHIQLFPV